MAAAAAERCCHCRGAEVREEWLARLFCWLGSVWVGAEIVLGCPTGSVSAVFQRYGRPRPSPRRGGQGRGGHCGAAASKTGPREPETGVSAMGET